MLVAQTNLSRLDAAWLDLVKRYPAEVTDETSKDWQETLGAYQKRLARYHWTLWLLLVAIVGFALWAHRTGA